MWVAWNGLQKNKTWTGLGSLPDVSNGRIKPISHKLTPKEPKEGGEVWSEEEYTVTEPIVVQVLTSSEYAHSGSGSCSQATSEHWITIEAGGTTTPEPKPSPVQPVQEFNNYNSHVECSNTDRATFTLNEPIQNAQAALWYDFGNVTQNVSYTLMTRGQAISRGSVKKGDCASGYTWCHGFIDLGDLGPGTYTVVASPARICHNVNHDKGNGFIMISGTPKR